MLPEPSPETLQRWNALAAEKLAGWRWMFCTDGSVCRYLVPPGEYPLSSDGWITAQGTEPVAELTIWPVPDYAHSLDAVSRLEAIVAERGHANAYVRALAISAKTTCALKDGPASVTEFGFRFATAPAHVRLEAVLKACGVLDES